jgi:hypothetical protein
MSSGSLSVVLIALHVTKRRKAVQNESAIEMDWGKEHFKRAKTAFRSFETGIFSCRIYEDSESEKPPIR